MAQALSRFHEVEGWDNFDDFYPRPVKERNVQEAGLVGRLRELDLLDAEGVRRAMREFRPDAVIHLAARAGVRPSLERPALYMRTNVEGTVHVYEACREVGVNAVILASSSSVYGSRNTVPFREDESVDRPQSPYAASKVAAELIAGTYARLYGIRTAILRFFTVYGPRQRPDLAIALFTNAILEGREVTLFGDGSSARDYTFVDDTVDGVLKALAWVVSQPTGHYDTFNLGENTMVSLEDLIQELERVLGRKARRRYCPMPAGDVPRTCADITRARDILGYNPKVGLREGLARYAAWVKERGGT